MSPALWDTHCHLQDPRYGSGLSTVLSRSRAAGVQRWVCVGTAEGDWEAVLELAACEPGVIPALGLHPWFAGEAAPGWERRLEPLLRDSGATVGECGLDFVLPGADTAAQERVLRLQWRLALSLDRPLTLHCRKGFHRLAALAREEGTPRRGAVVHAWSGSPEQLLELQDLGFHFGFGCSLAHPDNRRGPACARAARLDRLHLETDSPDLAPRFLPDWPAEGLNEPAHLPLALEAMARFRELPAPILAAQLAANAERVFGDPIKG